MHELTVGEWAAIRAVVACSQVPGRHLLLAALERTKPPTERTTA